MHEHWTENWIQAGGIENERVEDVLNAPGWKYGNAKKKCQEDGG